MPALYIRTRTPDGRRTNVKVGHFHPLSDTRWSLAIQVSPGKVYHVQVTESDLIPGSLHRGRP
jgi:hypothetical protein